MNQGQTMFFHYIMERVETENQEKAKELLNESFAKQEDGTFNQTYLANFILRMLELIKPECTEDVKNIMSNYRA